MADAHLYGRVTMCRLATEMTSSWLMVDPWEAFQPEYQRTAVVLDHFNHDINTVFGGVTTRSGAFTYYYYFSIYGGSQP